MLSFRQWDELQLEIILTLGLYGAVPLGWTSTHLQDDGAPHQVEHSKHDVFVVVLPVKHVVRDANDSHGHKGKRKVLQEAKVEGLAFPKVVANSI